MKRIMAPLLGLAALALAACSGGDGTAPSPEPSPPATAATASPAAATPAASPPPAASASVATASQPASAALAIPAAYQATYRELDAALAQFESLIKGHDTGRIGAISTSLIIANSNRGAALFAPGNTPVIAAYLDAVKAMGITAVEVQISFPIMTPDFPDEARYIAFYKNVVAMAHERGMKVLIETSCLFTGSEYTEIQFDYSRYSTASYFAGRRAQAVTIAREIRPDYISLGEEPVNETVFAGIRFSSAEYVAYVNSTVAAVRALGGDAGRVPLGVGTGTWQADLFNDFVRDANVDFLDIHIYPLTGGGGNQLDVARRMAASAKAKGRDVIIGESWLYKASAAETAANPGASTAEIFRRDAFTFWRPLELRLMAAVLAIGREFEMPVVSFWGGLNFFRQSDWTPELDRLGYAELGARFNRDTTANIVAGKLSPLGEEAKKLFTRP